MVTFWVGELHFHIIIIIIILIQIFDEVVHSSSRVDHRKLKNARERGLLFNNLDTFGIFFYHSISNFPTSLLFIYLAIFQRSPFLNSSYSQNPTQMGTKSRLEKMAASLVYLLLVTNLALLLFSASFALSRPALSSADSFDGFTEMDGFPLVCLIFTRCF